MASGFTSRHGGPARWSAFGEAEGRPFRLASSNTGLIARVPEKTANGQHDFRS